MKKRYFRKDGSVWEDPPPRLGAKSPDKPLFTHEQTSTYLQKIADQYKPNPLLVMNGGLQAQDVLVLEPKPCCGGKVLDGVNFYAERKGLRLLWQPQGFGRANDGRDVLLPFITSWERAGSFVNLVAEATGYDIGEIYQDRMVRRRYPLVEPTREVRRLLSGDSFSFADAHVQIERVQPVIDMNMQKPDSAGSIVYDSQVNYCSQAHHEQMVARLLTEANGLKYLQRGRSFLAVK